MLNKNFQSWKGILIGISLKMLFKSEFSTESKFDLGHEKVRIWIILTINKH